MSDSSQEQKLEGLLASLCNDTITSDQHAELQQMLGDDAEARQQYFKYLDLHHGLMQLHVDPEEVAPESFGSATEMISSSPKPSDSTGTPSDRGAQSAVRYMLAVALLVCASLILVLLTQAESEDPLAAEETQPGVARVIQTSSVKFASEVKPPGVGATLASEHEYSMRSGLIEIRFDSGAQVILEGPVVFEVAGPQRLVVQFGKCSVHAPEGAEGFVVETPLSRVVDLGTRFAVEVDEAGETDVQVIEGVAEVHRLTSDVGQSAAPERLTQGASRKYLAQGQVVSQEIPFNAGSFTRRLPDRVASYTATSGPDGGAQELTGVVVQRDGHLLSYAAKQLIETEVTHFHGAPSAAYMTVDLNDVDDVMAGSSRRILLDRDRKLNAGLINPGGSTKPLTDDPVVYDSEKPSQLTTPGLAVRFRKPVMNGPGADVVLFELHVIVQSEQGDAFHVSPLRFTPERKSHTVNRYDISLSSPEALKLSQFRLYKFGTHASSLAQFDRATHNGGVDHVIGAKALAVGIDLSDLGYRTGEVVEGLFFQDALDDRNYFDPVLIVGLPSLPSQNNQQISK